MKKNLFICALVAMFAFVASSFVTPGNEPSTTAPSTTKLTVTTGANGEIVSIAPAEGQVSQPGDCWSIRDLSGYTNIRQSPGGKVCMRLKAHTQYDIYTNGASGGWLRIASCYNCREGYWVRLHSSKTGSYWIARSVLY